MSAGERFELTIRAAKAGAEWALSALYREFHPGVLRYLRAREPGEAEDLASEVWIDVAEGLSGFEGDEAGFRCWLFTIARRRLIDWQRRAGRGRVNTVPFEPLAGDAESEALAGLATEAALARIAALPREQAEVLLLRVLGGLDVARVAALLGKRPGAVRVLQHRALRRLAEQLASEAVTR
jgi:RNA polymerase sigma-70 factor, ECF subfamily